MNDQKNYAGFGIRAVAFFIDVCLGLLGVTLTFYLLALTAGTNIFAFFPNFLWFTLYFFVVNGLVFFFLNPYLISIFGGTAGKLLTGLTIENEDGTHLTYKQALFREYVAKIASNALFGVGYFWIFKNEKKQTWHDMLSDTVVIVKSNKIALGLITLLLLVLIELTLGVTGTIKFSENKPLLADISTLFKDIGNSPVIPNVPNPIAN